MRPERNEHGIEDGISSLASSGPNRKQLPSENGYSA
jgi:hypothetical protein